MHNTFDKRKRNSATNAQVAKNGLHSYLLRSDGLVATRQVSRKFRWYALFPLLLATVAVVAVGGGRGRMVLLVLVAAIAFFS